MFVWGGGLLGTRNERGAMLRTRNKRWGGGCWGPEMRGGLYCEPGIRGGGGGPAGDQK